MALNRELGALWRHQSLRGRTVLYESFAGHGALCNPESIFRSLIDAAEFKDFHHVWVLRDRRHDRSFRREFSGNPRVTIVRYKSLRYFHALATVGYLVNNATFPPVFAKRPGQVYLNTWHGTPLKRMGYDMPDGAAESANTLRNFLSADFLLSQNDFMTERMYESAYRLRGVFSGRIIQTGSPRADRQVDTAESHEEVTRRLSAAGVTVGTRKVVLYAPTWKGSSFSTPDDDAHVLLERTRKLQEILGDEEYTVLLKPHQSVHARLERLASIRDVLVPHDLPVNLLLGMTSVLITDYSSIFFDFLSTGRPICFFTPDVDEYQATRGTYFVPQDLPGPDCVSLEQVAEYIDEASTPSGDNFRERRSEWRTRFAPHEDGSAAGRVIDVVFRGIMDDRRVFALPDDSRTKVLVHLGSMNSNGITSSALNLLSSFDYSTFDISVVFNRPNDGAKWENQKLIDPRVRQFHRTGPMGGSLTTHFRRRVAEVRQKGDSHRKSAALKRLWDDEWRRCFGDTRFDHIADFDGYGPFWATLFLHGAHATHAIWQHNDMAAERERIIRGRPRLRRSLAAVFSLYSQFDAIVAVSPALCELNRRNLSRPYGIAASAFVSARNLVNENRVIRGATIPLEHILSSDETQSEKAGSTAWIEEISVHEGTTWFATLGRFSVEKNQARLIRAFALVHQSDPSARLILVGYGPLRSLLIDLIRELNLTAVAHVVGPFANPFPVLAAADCFVLSSDYEGQPMVILEAAILGLPIVSTNFASIRDAIPDSVIRITERTDEDLAQGMLDALRGDVAPQHLDVSQYAETVLNEVIRALQHVHPEDGGVKP